MERRGAIETLAAFPPTPSRDSSMLPPLAAEPELPPWEKAQEDKEEEEEEELPPRAAHWGPHGELLVGAWVRQPPEPVPAAETAPAHPPAAPAPTPAPAQGWAPMAPTVPMLPQDTVVQPMPQYVGQPYTPLCGAFQPMPLPGMPMPQAVMYGYGVPPLAYPYGPVAYPYGPPVLQPPIPYKTLNNSNNNSP
jgi:hypothetical protein